MQFKIPFTNRFIGFSKNASDHDSKRRGLYFGKYSSRDPRSDLTGAKVNFKAMYQVYGRQSDVFACVREWMDNVGAGGYFFEDAKDPEKKINPTTLEDLERILNSEQTFEDFKNEMIRDLGICGNAFATFVENQTGTQVLGLQPLDPRSMAVVIDKHGIVHKYIQRVHGDDPVMWDPEDIIHFRNGRDPNNPFFGQSVIEAIIWEALTDMSATMQNYSFFQNNAVPSVVYILEDDLDETEEDATMDHIKKNFGGAENSHKSAILSGVKEIKTIGSTQTEMQFLEQRRFSTEKICSAYGVPKFMLGYTETVNNNNGVELTKKAMKKARTIELSFEKTFNLALGKKLKDYEGKIVFKYVEQPLEDPSELEKRAIDMFKNGVMTLQEAKNFLGHDVDADWLKDENFNKHMIHAGGSVRLLEDAGIDPIVDPNNQQVAENFVKALETLKVENETS